MPRRSVHKDILQKPRTEHDTKGVATPQRSYKVLSVSLYADQAEIVDRAAEELALAGFGKVNRSLVVQTAIQRLKEDLEGKDRKDVLQYFLKQQIKRPLNAARSRNAETVGIGPATRKRAAGSKFQ